MAKTIRIKIVRGKPVAAEKGEPWLFEVGGVDHIRWNGRTWPIVDGKIVDTEQEVTGQ